MLLTEEEAKSGASAVASQTRALVAAALSEREEITAQIAALRDRLQSIDKTLARAHSASELFGFSIPAIDVASLGAPTVNAFILAKASAVYPQPVRAAQLREEWLGLTGRAIHDKTFGMSLFRLSLKGQMRRDGRMDWYYVPTIPSQS